VHCFTAHFCASSVLGVASRFVASLSACLARPILAVSAAMPSDPSSDRLISCQSKLLISLQRLQEGNLGTGQIAEPVHWW